MVTEQVSGTIVSRGKGAAPHAVAPNAAGCRGLRRLQLLTEQRAGFSIDALEENLAVCLLALEADQRFVIGNGGLIGVSGAAEELFGAFGHGTIDNAKTFGGHARLLATLH